MKKWIITLFWVIALISLVQASETCLDIMEPSEAKDCTLISTWNYSNCTNTLVEVFDEGGNNIINYTFDDFGDSSLCNLTWNITDIGTYNLVMSNGDSGIITIKKGEFKMIAIIIGIFIIGLFFFIMAKLNTHWAMKILGYGISLLQIFNIAFLLYLNEANPIMFESFLKINFYVTLFAGMPVALVALLLIELRMSNPNDELSEQESDMKWFNPGGKWQPRK